MKCRSPIYFTIAALFTSTGVEALQPSSGPVSRRGAFASILGAPVAFLAAGSAANALDMDAFVNSELEKDTKSCDPSKDPKCKPKLTADEALCKYGQSGTDRGEACRRVKAAGGSLNKPGSQGKSLGGAYAM